MTRMLRICVLCVFCGLHRAPALAAQGMDHEKQGGGMETKMGAMMTPPSQAAFATIQDIVRKLRADPATDWSKVNLEALRQHLIDMDNVVMRSSVKQTNVDGGISLDITGAGEVTGAIRRMTSMHAMALGEEGTWVTKTTEIAGGARMIVTAKDPSDVKAVTMLRGLGFAGILTEGDHHAKHHMMLARGEGMMH